MCPSSSLSISILNNGSLQIQTKVQGLTLECRGSAKAHGPDEAQTAVSSETGEPKASRT